MTSRKAWIAGVAGVVLSTSTLHAQVPGTTAGAGALSSAALGAGGAAAAAAPAAPKSIFSFFGLSHANLQACKDKLCASQLGLMLNNMATGPVAGFTGGFIPPLCPPAPSADQIAAMEKKAPGGAEATAAKIKASEAEAKARVAAVEYLGTVDCSRWKEASKALITALRADTNECVRYAAARVLNSGCCCNKDTIEALKICVAGEDKDGNPPENSPRVKAAAFSALQNCLMRVPEVIPPEAAPRPAIPEGGQGQPQPGRATPEGATIPNLEPLPGQKPLGRSTMNAADGSHLAASHSVIVRPAPTYEAQLQRKTFTQTVNEARQALFDVARTPQQPATLPPGKRSVLNALIKARQDMNAKARTVPAPAPAPTFNDPGVTPSSFTPSASPGQGVVPAALAPQPGPMSSAGMPDDASPAVSSSEPRRGLVGIFLKSRNRRTEP